MTDHPYEPSSSKNICRICGKSIPFHTLSILDGITPEEFDHEGRAAMEGLETLDTSERHMILAKRLQTAVGTFNTLHGSAAAFHAVLRIMIGIQVNETERCKSTQDTFAKRIGHKTDCASIRGSGENPCDCK